ncbi:TadE/TadG family type IV pilus assembly protein [Bdellovibrio svalbardensis]|uniref:Type II secretion system protein n=1 Tax=Bdellovibrio svalbardensis TaxID=2972972 RepID=A0ABT6DDB1_9BACT|nr:hypothetical protein [Bdellovibrio svalbardensis]MDG0814825.1 hypothetical protein [Bdellovibrio svalbardensis]
MKSTLQNQRGQFVIEAVLLMVVMLGVFIASMNTLREGKYLANLIERPWAEVQGMLECGVWGPPSKACKTLPGQLGRQVSLKPN